MTVADIFTIAFGIVVIIVGVPILLCVIGVFMLGLVIDILDWPNNHEW